eukprot:2996986-Rhodomonas_salina.1
MPIKATLASGCPGFLRDAYCQLERNYIRASQNNIRPASDSTSLPLPPAQEYLDSGWRRRGHFPSALKPQCPLDPRPSLD